jgi:antitoxin component of MazEF toxin-antitoxin module
MGFKTKVQLIKRPKSEQWYINLPSALAQAMDFTKSEQVEWQVHDRKQLVLKRLSDIEPAIKKKR